MRYMRLCGQGPVAVVLCLPRREQLAVSARLATIFSEMSEPVIPGY